MPGFRPERPQKGNTRRLVVDQHVFPVTSIRRFAGAGDRVDLVDGRRKMVRPAKPDDKIFCARRAWDQRADTGYMKDIEDRFQQLAEAIVLNSDGELEPHENAVVSGFYALWHYRSRQRSLPQEFLRAEGVTGSHLTADQHELLESKGVLALRSDGSLAARHINGMQIQILIGKFVAEVLQDATWGRIVSQEAEFCVPDVPEHGIIPINPKLCLVKGSASGIVTSANVAEINRAFISMSREYFFARDVTACPGWSSSILGYGAGK